MDIQNMLSSVALEGRIIEIVLRAVNLIKDTRFEIEEKGNPSNIVTSSDIAVQHFLQGELSALLPHSGFYCEEEDLQDLSSEYVWVIDPIDGTANYARGIFDSCVSVALLHRQQALVGVVANIFTGDVYSATMGLGARQNGKPISVSVRGFEDGILCTAMCVYKKDHARVCSDIIYDAYMQCNDVRRFGSCALELCYLAAGRCDLYFEIRVFPWDYAAAYLILKEAGGELYGFAGEELKFDKPTVLIGANSRDNYSRLNDIVLAHLDKIPYEE